MGHLSGGDRRGWSCPRPLAAGSGWASALGWDCSGTKPAGQGRGRIRRCDLIITLHPGLFYQREVSPGSDHPDLGGWGDREPGRLLPAVIHVTCTDRSSDKVSHVTTSEHQGAEMNDLLSIFLYFTVFPIYLCIFLAAPTRCGSSRPGIQPVP